MPRQAVEAPQPRVPRYSLLIAAPTVVDGARWEAGVQFAPEACAGGGRVAVDCIGGTDALDPDDPDDWADDWVTGDPFAVWAADRCSTFGWQRRQYAERARRALLASQSFQIADEVWSGSLVGDPVLLGQPSVVNANRPLNSVLSDRVTTAAETPTEALALTVAALGKCGEGRQGMIHVTSQVLQHLIADAAVYRDGGLWYSAMGHLVVADDGYDGSGPGGEPASSSQWMYGTSMIELRLGEIFTTPRLDEEVDGNLVGWSAAIDPATNLVTVLAQRLVLPQWDRCCHIAAQVDLPVPAIGGAS